MAEENQKISYRGKYFRQSDGKDRGNRTFWLIMICVSFVMSIMIFLLVPHRGCESAPEAPPPQDETAPATSGETQPSHPGDAPAGFSVPRISDEEARDLLAKAEVAFANRDYASSAEYAGKIVSAKMDEGGTVYDKALPILNKSGMEVLFGDAQAPNKKAYTIQKGDTLDGIAKNFNTTVEMVQTANHLDPASSVIFPGKNLTVYNGKWNIRVSKGKFRLCLYDGDRIFKVYDIGVGKDDRTPAGSFLVKIKQKEPAWYVDGKSVPYGDKENILGTRWMSLNPEDSAAKTIKGFGIHGTWEQGSIRTATSNGSIRMSNSDVEELFRIIPYNTKVSIED